ncbi:hypothetical protein DPMN_184883 [Dreissena polymorpha]|uniref:Uncharacterized protein n=1 Tax=Dreissena polymorpha TaxID=45954 RepID=A0A9D4DIQ1_DREPO|nr:hypothetical protein DPMN_184883 [Dreissena polymorpha]
MEVEYYTEGLPQYSPSIVCAAPIQRSNRNSHLPLCVVRHHRRSYRNTNLPLCSVHKHRSCNTPIQRSNSNTQLPSCVVHRLRGVTVILTFHCVWCTITKELPQYSPSIVCGSQIQSSYRNTHLPFCVLHHT